MKNITKLIVMTLLLTLTELTAMSQSNFSFDFTGLGFEFGDAENAPIYKIKCGDGTKTLLEPGLRLAAEVYETDKVSLKFAQTFRIDEMKKLAMSSQIMLRLRFFKIYKHSLSVGVGPTAFYRQTWQNCEGYIDEGVYKDGTMQTKICWLSAEVEYNYYLTKHNDLSFCITHLNPEAMGFAIGLKHWFSRKSNKCDTCPSFH